MKSGAQECGHLAGPGDRIAGICRLLVQLLQEAAVELLLGGQLMLPQLFKVTDLLPSAAEIAAAAGGLFCIFVVLLVGEHVCGDSVGQLGVQEVARLVLLHVVHLLCQGVW